MKKNKILKKGDAVTIQTKSWYNKKKDAGGYIGDDKVPFGFVPSMVGFCGKEAVIIEVKPPTEYYPKEYRLDIDKGFWSWSEEMFQKPKKVKAE